MAGKYSKIIPALVVLTSFIAGKARLCAQTPTPRPAFQDLSSWDGKTAIALQGPWYVFPREFLDVSHINARLSQMPPPDRSPIGRSFQDLEAGVKTGSNYGYATYALVVKNLPRNERLAISAPTIFSAAELFWVSLEPQQPVRRLAGYGKVATSAQDFENGISGTNTIELPSESHGVLVIHASNFYHTWGGFWKAPELAPLSLLTEKAQARLNGNYLSIGILLFIAFFSFSLYFKRREDRGSLWLALLASIFALRSFNYIGGLNPYLPPEWRLPCSLKVIYATMVLIPTVAVSFFQVYFPKQVSERFRKGLNYTMYPLALIIFLSPNALYGQLGYPLVYISGALMLVILVAIIRAFLAKEEGSSVCLLGIFGVFVGAALEFIGAFGLAWVPTNAMVYGLNFFVMFQSQIVVSHFVRAFRNSEHLSRELKREVDRQTRDIRSILDNIKQGIFTLVESGCIGPQYSPYTKELTQSEELEGKNLQELLLAHSELSSDQKDQIEATLSSSLGEDILNFEANQGCLPNEIMLTINGQRKVFEVDWNPIVDEADTIEKLLVCLRDVTEVRKLKLEAAQRQQELYILQEIIQVPEDKFGRFLHKAREFLQENAHIIERDAKGVSQNCKRLFVNYHTLKGTARTYHLKTLSAQTHEAEHLLTEIMKGQTSWDRERLRSDLQRLEQCLESYYLTAKEKLHWNLDRETVTMKKEEMIDLLPLIQDIESDVCSSASRSKLQTLSVRILEHCYTRLNDIIQEAANGLDSIARDLLKEVPELTIRPNHHLLVDEWADKFHGVLAHILRNSLDHGLERPEVRRRAGKRSCGNIFIQVEQIDDYLMVAVHDDGRGLDLEKIQATATKRGLLSSQLTTDQEIAQLIFESGLSTKSQVDELSGRGVGMDAVKSYIEDGGGRVLLTLDENFIDRHHVPFRIELYLPASAWVRIQLSDAQPLAS